MHIPSPVRLIYLKPWREFRKFHYDPHSWQCSRPDWGHPSLQSLSPLYVHTHKHTHWVRDTSVTDTLLLSIRVPDQWQRYTHTYFFTFPNQSRGPNLIKTNQRPQFKHHLLFIFLKPYNLKSPKRKHFHICQNKKLRNKLTWEFF